MTKSDNQTHNILKIIIWALTGAVFISNSFICQYYISDGGITSAISAALGVFIIIVPMLGILYRNFKVGKLKMNELVIIAVIAAFSQQNFQMAGGIAFFMLISLIVESKTATGAHASLEALAKLSPGKARRIKNDKEEEIEPENLNIGDLIRVRPGENILADAKITKGNTSINEANITGESIPVDKIQGDKIFAGTINMSNLIEAIVEKQGKNTTLAKVRELILNAEKTRLPFVRMMDKYSAYYTPLVLMFSVMVWYFTGDLNRVVSVLVVACPIAIILSNSSAIVAALSASARLGILIKNVNDIEALSNISAFVFDKTGTLTKGTLVVSKLAPVKGIESSDLLKLAATLESNSNHPVAKAVMKLANKVNISTAQVTNVFEKPGRGIKAQLDGKEFYAGNMSWMKEAGANISEFPDFTEEETNGMSLLFLISDMKPCGWLALEDEVRTESKEVINNLKNENMHVSMVTGDRKSVAIQVAEHLNIESWDAECIPSKKVDFVKQIKINGHKTVFIGDGVNDGPALASSNIGIAMGAAGSDVAIESATIALMNNNLKLIPFLFSLAKDTKLITIQNCFLGGLFIIIGITLATLGHLLPIVAAIMQVVGSILVVMNSARLVKKGEDL